MRLFSRSPLRRVFVAACLGLATLGALNGQPVVTRVVPDGKPHRFEARDHQFFLDREPTLILSGEMHFGRVLPEDWDTRIKQAKAMGLNTVSFYLFWNLCEPTEGRFEFSGMTDVRRMLQLCQANGMWAILRPGPYCCAEVEYGGLPWWTAKYPEVTIRSNDVRYVAWSRRYFEQVARQVADLQVTRGGPLLLLQLENEFGMISRGNVEHLATLRNLAREVGFDIPLFTCDPFLRPPASDAPDPLPGVIRGRNGLRNDRDYEQTVAANRGLPAFVPELYTAWFSGWGQPLATRHTGVQEVVDWTGSLLDKNVSFNYYMFFGGTTFGFFNGANEFLPVQTSYDYSAPIDEAGRTTEKFRALRRLLSTRLKLTPPAPPPEPTVRALPTIALTEHEALLDTLPDVPTRAGPKPLSMESLDQAYGAVVYRKKFADGLHGVLHLRDAMDYAIVMANGRTVGRAFRGYGPESASISIDATGPTTLDIFVYNLGRISVIVSERSQARARKGLLGGAFLGEEELTDWEMFSMRLDHPRVDRPSDQTPVGPTLYRGSFDVAEPAGTFLDLRHWSMGAVWVNGHNLGRFWDHGGLRSLFLPRHWVKAGKNEIVVLELHEAPTQAEIPSDTRIIEAPAIPFAYVLDRFNPTKR